MKEKGVSTLKPRKIWFDETVQRLNVDERGTLIGEFRGEDRILVITQSGIVKTIVPDITTHFSDDMIVLEKWIPNKPISAIYFDGAKEKYFVKRFLIENENKEEVFISSHASSTLEIVSTDWRPVVELTFAKDRGKDRRPNQTIDVEQFIDIKGISAQGNQLSRLKVNQIDLSDPLPYEAPKEVHADEMEVVDEEVVDANTSEEIQSDISESKPSSESSAPSNPSKNNENNSNDSEGQITLF